MEQTVRMWVRSCQDCGSRKARPKDIIPPLRPIKAGNINDRWAMDTITMTKTKEGYQYAICFTEYVSRLAVVVKCKTRKAEEVARALIDHVILVHGPIRELLCDGAKEFTSGLLLGVVNQLQMHQNSPVPYRPNMMGLVERFNRTIKDMLAMYVNEDQTDWDMFLPMVVYVYNTSIHESTGFQPFEIMYGRKGQSPDNLHMQSQIVEIKDLPEWNRNFQKPLKAMRDIARKRLLMEQARYKKQYDKRCRGKIKLRKDMLVWIYRPWVRN